MIVHRTFTVPILLCAAAGAGVWQLALWALA